APPTTYTLYLHDALPISTVTACTVGTDEVGEDRIFRIKVGEHDLALFILCFPVMVCYRFPSRIEDDTDRQEHHGSCYRTFFPVRSEEHTSELQSRFDLVC